MSRKKGVTLKDQVAKTNAIATYLGWTKDAAWANELGVQTTTVHNWKKNQPISNENIISITSIINKKNTLIQINSQELVDLTIEQFCKKLCIEPIDVKFENKLFENKELTGSDVAIMKAISGRYHAIYLARRLSSGQAYLDCEPIRIGDFVTDKKIVYAWQEYNKTAASPGHGILRVTNGRAICVLQWNDLYPESTYLLLPITWEDQYAFYGIYLDINEPPVMEIFAARVLIVPFVDSIGERRKVENSDQIFMHVSKLLDDSGIQKNRTRFVVSPSQETLDMVREALSNIYGGKA